MDEALSPQGHFLTSLTAHGVATKYLESYLGWIRLLDREKNITARQLLAVFIGESLTY